MKFKLGERLLLALGPLLASVLIRLLVITMRLEYVGDDLAREYWRDRRHLIFVFWHDQLFLMVKSYRGPGARILISSSKDGELIARTMARFGLGAVRGSSHRGGRAAFRELLELTEQPFDIGITPDGPKGPRHQVKEGAAQLARLSGRAVMPIAFACSRGTRFSSWDRFLLPHPFSRGVFSYGPPLQPVAGESTETFRLRLQAAMEENQLRAVTHLEMHGVSAV